MRRLRSIWGHEGGNTALIFGLAVIPIVALSGGAVDLSHRADVRMQMQSATDTAALAAARIMQDGQFDDEARWGRLKAQAREAAGSIFRAGTASAGGEAATAEPDIDITQDLVRVSANLDVPTSFLNILGIGSLPAAAYAEVNLPDPIAVEIALVLDYSGSMRQNDKYVRMTDAATTFIRKVAEDRAERSKIGIVPFSDFVYATVTGRDVRATPANEANNPVSVCLSNRDYPYSATDERPQLGISASRWEGVDAAAADCQPYAAGSLKLQELTNDFSGLTAALEAMQPVHMTNIALATELGWHLLTPGAPFESAGDPADPMLKKILILLTDGVQTIEAMGPDGSISTAAADDTTAELCRSISDAGIRLFTVAYDVDDERVKGLLEGCATTPANYHDARSATDISGVFETIYEQIAESVWLAR